MSNLNYTNPASGSPVATKEVGGEHIQKVALVTSTDDAAAAALSATNFVPVRLTDGSAYLAALPITDNGGSLTVDGTVAVTGTFWQATQPVSLASVPSHDVTNAGTFAVQAAQSGTWNVTNISGTVSLPTGAATAANQATIIGHIDGVESSLSSLDGKITACNTGAVVVSSSALPTGAATAAKQPALGTAGAASADVITVQGAASMTPLQVGDNSGSLTVDAPVGTPVFVRLSDGASAIATLPVSLASVPSHAVTNAGTFAVQAAGDVAHDSADSGNPVKVGGKAVATPSTATMVAAADRTDATFDLDGALLTRPGCTLGDVISERISNTDGNSTATTNFAATANARNCITAVVVYNSSATAGYVDFRDGTGGSVLYTVPLPAGGGAVVTLGGAPLFRTTANTALAFDVSAALTTVYISLTGFKSKV